MHTKTEHPEALPIVPQIHCAFLYFTEEFKAALQLRPGAVGPQPPHVHHSSLLLLVKRTDSAEGKRLKGGVLFFLSPFSFLHRAPNELVLITPVDTAGDFGGPPPVFVPLFHLSVVFPLWLVQPASSYLIELQFGSAFNLPWHYNSSFSLQLIKQRQSDFYQMMPCLKFGAASSFLWSLKIKQWEWLSYISQKPASFFLFFFPAFGSPTHNTQQTWRCSLNERPVNIVRLFISKREEA